MKAPRFLVLVVLFATLILVLITGCVASFSIQPDVLWGNPEEGPKSWPIPTGASGQFHDTVITHLRTDLQRVKTSGNYYTRFKAAQYTEGAEGNEFTHAFFRIVTGSHTDIVLNTGLLTTSNEVRWFVFVETVDENMKVECLRGTMVWDGKGEEDLPYSGCLGDNEDIVGLNTWHGVRYVKTPNGYWNIRVEDSNRKSYLVARVKSDASEIAFAHTMFMESTESNENPSILGGFWHDQPYFFDIDRMRIWPDSVPSNNPDEVNYASVSDRDSCPRTHAIKDEITSDEQGSWYTGVPFGDKKGFVCSAIPLW
jgi:hypothetical protein